MKYIKIDDNSRFSCEDSNYILEYRIKKGDFQGKKGVGFKWDIAGYFPNIDTLLNDWVTNAPSHSEKELKTLRDVVAVIQNAETHIEKLVHKK